MPAAVLLRSNVKGAQNGCAKRFTPRNRLDNVTTPKGCTIAGLNEMEHQGFSSSLIKGLVASFNRIAKD